MDNFWIFETEVPSEDFLIFEERIGDLVESLTWQDGILEGMAHEDHCKEIEARLQRSLEWKPMEQIDWLEEDEKRLPPITVGDLFIFTPYYEGEVPEGKIPLRLRSSYAFGSGHHPTTEGCLEVIQRSRRIKRALDIGCGSAILSLALEAVHDATVIGTEIDEKSVEIARENVEGKVTIVHCDGVSAGEIADYAPFDFIVSNIHSGPLIALAPSIVPLLDSEGVLVLAGLLKEQQEAVVEAYGAQGLLLKGVHGNDPDWPVLEFMPVL